MLNRDSRNRSLVGRMVWLLGAASARPRSRPPTTRISVGRGRASAAPLARSAPSPTQPGLARVSHDCAQVGQARLAMGQGDRMWRVANASATPVPRASRFRVPQEVVQPTSVAKKFSGKIQWIYY